MRRNQRLRQSEQFSRVRREGKTWSHAWLSLNAARNRAGRTRCGFVVGKQLGKAHDRNRAKRRVREAVRQIYPNIARGWDLVFVVRPPVIDAPFDRLLDVVRGLLQRGNLWVAPVAQQELAHAPSPSVGDHQDVPIHLAPDSA